MMEGTGATPVVFIDRCRGSVDQHSRSKSSPPHLPSVAIRLASPSDLPAIHAFARAYMTDVPAAEIAACLKDPTSYPHDVILAFHGQEVVGMAQVARRVMHFGRARCQVGLVRWLRVLPDLRASDLPSQLLARLEQHARTIGLHLGLSWTRWPRFFQLHDWVPVYQPPVVEMMVDPFLAELSAKGLLRAARRRRKVNIRPVRRWDIHALARLYAQETSQAFGAFERTETYWDWLLDRRGFDQLYVVAGEEGADKSLSGKSGIPTQAVTAYYVRRGWRIVEILTPPTETLLAVEILVHACREAKEQNRNWLLVDLPTASALRSLLTSARSPSASSSVFQGPVLVAKIWDLPELLKALMPQFEWAIRQQGENTPTVLGLQVGARRLSLLFDGECSSLIHCHLAPEFVKLSLKDFTQLLFGQVGPGELNRFFAVERTASSPKAVQLARAAFVPPYFWRSTLDDLPALV